MKRFYQYGVQFLAVLVLVGCLLPPAAAAEADNTYTMQIHNGVVAVWDHGRSAWLLHSDVPEAMLRESDRILLRKGLELSGPAALTQAMEDFCS